MLTTRIGLAALLAAAFAFSVLTGAASAASPAAVTGGVTNVSTTSARLTGSVDPNSEATSWYFEFGPTSGYGTRTATQSAGSGANPTNVATNISGLAVATTFHYRVVAMNASGTTLGADRTFITDGPPAVALTATQNAVSTTATVTGTADARGRSTTWRVDYGTTTAYGSRTPNRNVAAGHGAVAVSETLTNLTPGTTYHVRIVASNSAGNTTSADATFATVP